MRKNHLQDLVGSEPAEKLTAVNSPATGPAPLGSRGAVGAMRHSIPKLNAGHAAVVEIDPSQIDVSIVPDRMPESEAQHQALVEAIRANGQLVPVLLRPHSADPQRYQVAYGHRRVRALRALGRPVKAMVRAMDDADLVIAQGQENNARRDLSFIEKAMFAAALEDRKFQRETTIVAALAVDKTEVSRLIAVARAIPAQFVEAVGPAPKAGRRRWMNLARRLQADGVQAKAVALIASADFEASEGSDARFTMLFEAVAPPQTKPRVRPRPWCDPHGRVLARMLYEKDNLVLSIDRKLEPGFAGYLARQLTEIYKQYEAASAPTSAPTPDT